MSCGPVVVQSAVEGETVAYSGPGRYMYGTLRANRSQRVFYEELPGCSLQPKVRPVALYATSNRAFLNCWGVGGLAGG